MDEIIRPGNLYYYDEFPAWTIRVPQPSRFQDVRLGVSFAAFPLPTACLIACIIRLYDIPDQPFYVHRVFDLTDEGVAEYVERSAAKKHWVLEIRGGGQDADVFRILSLEHSDLRAVLSFGINENKKKGSVLDGEKALKDFLASFEPAAKDGGWEAGWDAVREAFDISV